MICALYTLKSIYKNRKVYIWNVNRNSIGVFTEAAFRKIDVQGFVVSQEEYAGEMYMNRPVLPLSQIEHDENIIILVNDEVAAHEVKILPVDKWVYWSEAVEINESLREQKVIVYGTGNGADQLCKELESKEIETELYCVTKKDSTAHYRGKNIIEAAELDQYRDYAVIISVKKEQYRNGILKTLSCFPGAVYVENVLNRLDVLHINLIPDLDFAIKNHKKIYLYSKRDALAELLEEVLSIYGMRISGYVQDMEDESKNIQNIYTLACEGTEDKLIVINESTSQRLVEIRKNIELAGFSLESGNYTGLQWYTRAKKIMLSELHAYDDPLTGYSILYPQNMPGWKIYGKEGNGVRILVLGGSTSSEEYHPENWISKLYHKFKEKNMDVTIYNGAHINDDIVTELLRLLRDGPVLLPQIVISMSGVNNLHYKKCVNQFNEERLINWVRWFSTEKEYCSGVPDDESLYFFWSRNVRLMKEISEFYGARFYGFLQPMNITMENKSIREKSMYEREAHMIGAMDFARLQSDNDDYVNLMRLFEHQDEMYFDMCHYTDRGHEIIADKVYEVIEPTVQMALDDKIVQ